MNKEERKAYTEKVRAINDRLRKSIETAPGHETQHDRWENFNTALYRIPGMLLALTDGVASLDMRTLDLLLRKVVEFDAFTPDNDPYGEHDFGNLTMDDTLYYFKWDYYDKDLEFASEDAANEDLTSRVLTVMRADEY